MVIFSLFLDSEDIYLDVSIKQPVKGQFVTFTCKTRAGLGITEWRFHFKGEKPQVEQSPEYSHYVNNDGVWYCDALNDKGITLISNRIYVPARGTFY